MHSPIFGDDERVYRQMTLCNLKVDTPDVSSFLHTWLVLNEQGILCLRAIARQPCPKLT